MDDLVHGRDACPSTDHTEVLDVFVYESLRRVQSEDSSTLVQDVSAYGGHMQDVTLLYLIQVLCEKTSNSVADVLEVNLDEEINIPFVRLFGDGMVISSHILLRIVTSLHRQADIFTSPVTKRLVQLW